MILRRWRSTASAAAAMSRAVGMPQQLRSTNTTVASAAAAAVGAGAATAGDAAVADAALADWQRLSSVRVYGNALAQMHVREFERKFEIYKAAYERPIAQAFASLQRERAMLTRKLKSERKKLRAVQRALAARNDSSSSSSSSSNNNNNNNAATSGDVGASVVPTQSATAQKSKSRTPLIDRRLKMIEQVMAQNRQELALMAGKLPRDMLKTYEEVEYDAPVDAHADSNADAEAPEYTEYGTLVSVEDVSHLSAEQLRAAELRDDVSPEVQAILHFEPTNEEEIVRAVLREIDEETNGSSAANSAANDELDDFLLNAAIDHVVRDPKNDYESSESIGKRAVGEFMSEEVKEELGNNDENNDDNDDDDDDDDDENDDDDDDDNEDGDDDNDDGDESDNSSVRNLDADANKSTAGDGASGKKLYARADHSDGVSRANAHTGEAEEIDDNDDDDDDDNADDADNDDRDDDDDHDDDEIESDEDDDDIDGIDESEKASENKNAKMKQQKEGEDEVDEDQYEHMFYRQDMMPLFRKEEPNEVDYVEAQVRAQTGSALDDMLTELLLKHKLMRVPSTFVPSRPSRGIAFFDTHRPDELTSATTQYELNDAVFRERRVSMLLNLAALEMPPLVEARFIQLVGQRYNAETRIVKISADTKPNKAENKALLVETLRALLNEAFLADSNYIPPAYADADAAFMSPSAHAAAYEQSFLEMLAATGVDVKDPLRLGPAFAPASFANMVARDIAADNDMLRVRAPRVKGVPTTSVASAAAASEPCMFRFERVPQLADVVAARSACRALAQQLVADYHRK